MSEDQLQLPYEWPPGTWEALFPFFGKGVLCTVPVKFYSDEWHDGVRSVTYVGTVCSHHAGGFCLQPPARQQGIDEKRGQCFVLTGEEKLEPLPPGTRASDW